MLTYEQLKGGEGDLIHYRPERFAAKDMFQQGIPDVTVGGHPLVLQDLSIGGVGVMDHCRADAGPDWTQRIGERLPVRLSVRGEVIHASMAEVRRCNVSAGKATVGLRLVDRHLDMAGLIEKYWESTLRGELAYHTAPDLHLVAPEYRRLVADTQALLRHTRRTLARMEEKIGADGPSQQQITGRMLSFCEEQIVPRWRELWLEANAMLWPVMDDPARLRATKKFTEEVLTPELVGGPIWHRGYDKPFGYPGDFLLMKQIYDNQWEGVGAYHKICHRLGVHIGEFVANRMLMMKDEIAESVFDKNGEDTTHITSLGSGPAQEVQAYLDALSLPGSTRFTLIDQDRRALDLAHTESRRRVLQHGGRARVDCLWTSFMQLLRPGAFLEQMPAQDLIYSVGLIDYLTDRRTGQLIERLYKHLAPGGRLVLGNVKRSSEASLWPLEFIADWSLIYRSEEDMTRLAATIPEAKQEVFSDETNCVVVMRLTKPAE
jgi:SAM-dependent methyltransferase